MFSMFWERRILRLILERLTDLDQKYQDILDAITAENTLDDAIGTYVDDVVADNDALEAKVADLEAQLLASGQPSAEVSAALDAIKSGLATNAEKSVAIRDKLAAAVTANTPAADVPTDETGGGTTGADTSSGQDTTTGQDTTGADTGTGDGT